MANAWLRLLLLREAQPVIKFRVITFSTQGHVGLDFAPLNNKDLNLKTAFGVLFVLIVKFVDVEHLWVTNMCHHRERANTFSQHCRGVGDMCEGWTPFCLQNLSTSTDLNCPYQAGRIHTFMLFAPNSDPTIWNWGLPDQRHFFQSSIVRFWWACVNCVLTFLFLADRSNIWCGVLLL